MSKVVCIFLILKVMIQNVSSSFATKTSPPSIIACSSPTEVQRAISFYIKPQDHVIELGSQLSETSTDLCRKIGPEGKAKLVDVKRKDASSGRSSNRNTKPFIATDVSDPGNEHETESGESFVDRVDYEELEQFDQWRHLTKGKQFQAMILDVGTMIGNDLYLSALSLAGEFIANQETPPRVVIIKSKNLANLARRIVHSQRLLDKSTALPDDLERTHEPIVIPCVGVNEYRRTIPFLVNEGDHVIEVGCHFGRTTTILNDAVTANGFCVGVDIGPKIIANAKKQHPDISFAVIDAWNTLDLIKVKAKQHDNSSIDMLGYDVVFADIGGLSGAHGLLESLALLDAIAKALEPRCIVIKSLCMNRLASQLIAFSSIWNKVGTKE